MRENMILITAANTAVIYVYVYVNLILFYCVTN